MYGHPNSTYPCRQSKESIDELIHTHQIKHSFTLQQSKIAIDSGVFHNDVISFGFKDRLFCHQQAFEDQANQLNQLKRYYQDLFQHRLTIIEINQFLWMKPLIPIYLIHK